MSLRETVFWQNSEHAGFTTRVDLEKVFADDVAAPLDRRPASISQESEGVFGYSAITALRGLPQSARRGVRDGLRRRDGRGRAAARVRHQGGVSPERDARLAGAGAAHEPHLAEGGPDQPREPSWGVGIGFEMFFGTDEFLARPVTF